MTTKKNFSVNPKKVAQSPRVQDALKKALKY